MLGCEGLGGILKKKAETSELDVFYPIRSECHADIPKTRFKLRVSSLPLPFGHLLISFLYILRIHCLYVYQNLLAIHFVIFFFFYMGLLKIIVLATFSFITSNFAI